MSCDGVRGGRRQASFKRYCGPSRCTDGTFAPVSLEHIGLGGSAPIIVIRAPGRPALAGRSGGDPRISRWPGQARP